MESLQQASLRQTTVVTLVLATCLASAAFAETKREFRFTVGPNANVSVDTQYGAISVKPGSGNEVVVTATLKSDKVEVDKQQNGNRIEIASYLLQGADQQTGRVDYEVLIPPDANINLRSSNGPLSVERLQGDLTLEESLKLFEEGVGLSATCKKELDEAEGKVQMLVKQRDGSLKAEPFPAEKQG